MGCRAIEPLTSANRNTHGLRISAGAQDLKGLSKRTVDSAIDKLRLEYDCNTVGGLIYRLFKLGLIK